jgi:hypothetical protein
MAQGNHAAADNAAHVSDVDVVDLVLDQAKIGDLLRVGREARLPGVVGHQEPRLAVDRIEHPDLAR